MGNPAGQSTNCFHFLRLDKLCFEFALGGNVMKNSQSIEFSFDLNELGIKLHLNHVVVFDAMGNFISGNFAVFY